MSISSLHIPERLKSMARLVRTKTRQTSPEKAYDIWAASYDHQPGNLLLSLEDELFGNMISKLQLPGKAVLDIGCGTGRHWPTILGGGPGSLKGYDVSEGMLAGLREKFKGQEVHKLYSNRIAEADQSCDVLISTLTIAHIADFQDAFEEWDRVLKPGGDLVITDYHPDALSRDAHRTFSANGKTYAVQSYIHPLGSIRELCGGAGMEQLQFAEKCIDPSTKEWFEQQRALHVYNKFAGTPIVYALHLKKRDADR